MITPKASKKWFGGNVQSSKEGRTVVSLMIVSPNVLVEDFTKNGEVIIKELNPITNKFE